MKVDVCSLTQNGKRTLSFMSQVVGLIADLDIGTDHLRWMGEARFTYGFLRGRTSPLFTRHDVSDPPKSSNSRRVPFSCLINPCRWTRTICTLSIKNDARKPRPMKRHVKGYLNRRRMKRPFLPLNTLPRMRMDGQSWINLSCMCSAERDLIWDGKQALVIEAHPLIIVAAEISWRFLFHSRMTD